MTSTMPTQASSPMDSSAVLTELAPLLAPIRPDAPAGDWLYYDRAYDLIREARREDDQSLPRGIWKREMKRANWSEVIELSAAALTSRTKDLQIAAWLLEAWTKTHGFTGAMRGFQLIHGLSTRYWEGLYPLADGDDLSARSMVIDWVNENLDLLLQSIPLTKSADLDLRNWTWNERVDALRNENMVLKGKASPPSPGSNVLTSAKMFASIMATPRSFFVKLRDDLAGALDAAKAVEDFFDEKFGIEAPSLTRVLEVFKTIHQWVVGVLAQHVTEDKTDRPAVAPPALPVENSPAARIIASTAGVAATGVNMNEDSMESSPSAAGVPMVDHARARADAYRKLAEAAHTLMRIEPHSPTPYLVFRAIAWGEMSLAELMRHFITSGYDLKSLYAMLGMEEQKPTK